MTFTLSEKEKTKLNEWIDNHDCVQVPTGAIGGKRTYCFTPTNIGTAIVIKCVCGKEIDLTTYEGW